MSAYEYAALDSTGREHKGVLEGDTARQVRQQLRERGWTPLAVDEVAEPRRQRGGLLAGRRSASARDIALFTRQLATLVGAGTPVEEALRATARQTERPRMRNLVTGVRASVVEGRTLADGLAQYPRAFPDLYRATVAAGEQTGRLDVVLERLADLTDRRQALRQTVLQALLYPLALVLVAIGVVLALLTYVVPKVTRVFEDTGQALPVLTQVLIAVSDFLRDWGWLLALVLAAAIAAFVLALRRIGFRRNVHRAMLRAPLIGRLVRGLNAGRFARTFAIMVDSGVPVLEALGIASGVIANLPMREAVSEAAGRIREGTGISTALEQSGQFPPMLIHLIASGENSGRLHNMLERAAANQERELESTIGTVIAAFEPLLIVTMGAIVLVIVLAIMQPIFQMNQLVS